MHNKDQTLDRRALPIRHDDEDDDEIDLLQLWHTLWRRKWSILSLVVVVVMLTTLVVLSITPIYRAASTLLIEQKAAKVVSIEQVYGLEGTGNEYLQTQFELLRSRSLAERVVRELDLATHPEFDPRQQPEPFIQLDPRALLERFDFAKAIPLTLPQDLEEAPAATEEQLFDSVTRAFMERINVEPQGKTQMVRIEVEMADARMAARAANALAKGFIESQLEARMDMSMTATNWMNSRLGELRDKLKSAEDRLQAYREQENLVDVQGVATVTANELSLTGDRMIDARRQRAEAESQYRQVQSMRSGGWEKLATVPAVLGHPLIQQFKAEEARARAKVEELSKRYGPRHPSMESARTELKAATASLRGQVEQIVAGIERNYQLAVANENSLRASFDANKAQIQTISRKEFRLRELQREVETNRTLYDTFMNRLKETAATSDLESANARVVDEATLPVEPVKPRKSLIVGIAGLLALFVGIGLALLVESLENTFKSTEDVETKLNLPVLGILPLVKGRPDGSRLAHLFHANSDKAFAESVRTVRTSLVLADMSTPHKRIVVTSSVPGEGKTSVSANLAYALAQVGDKVLLIDADMRRPTLAKNFELPVGTPGLANLIAGNARLEDCIKHLDGVDLLAAGTVPPDPLELLSSPRFAALLDTLSAQYTRIIIDTPPTQAVSDPMVLGTLADALVYVIKSDSTATPLAIKGVGQLLQHNAPVTGVVLNQVDVKKAQRYGYRYGGYYDYYGYSAQKA